MDTSFERAKNGESTTTWLTPPALINALGKFDLDPCMPENRPWDTATLHYTEKDNGLIQQWNGRVWCNPPYGEEGRKWMAKCADHGNCIAIIFARTQTRMFFESVWDKADAVLFVKGRIKFHRVSGEAGLSAGAPSVLVAYGPDNATALEASGIQGKFIRLKGKML